MRMDIRSCEGRKCMSCCWYRGKWRVVGCYKLCLTSLFSLTKTGKQQQWLKITQERNRINLLGSVFSPLQIFKKLFLIPLSNSLLCCSTLSACCCARIKSLKLGRVLTSLLMCLLTIVRAKFNQLRSWYVSHLHLLTWCHFYCSSNMKNPSKEMIINTFLGGTKQSEISCHQNTVEEGLQTCCPSFSLILTYNFKVYSNFCSIGCAGNALKFSATQNRAMLQQAEQIILTEVGFWTWEWGMFGQL